MCDNHICNVRKSHINVGKLIVPPSYPVFIYVPKLQVANVWLYKLLIILSWFLPYQSLKFKKGNVNNVKSLKPVQYERTQCPLYKCRIGKQGHDTAKCSGFSHLLANLFVFFHTRNIPARPFTDMRVQSETKQKHKKKSKGKKNEFIHTVICTTYCTLLHLQDLSSRILNPL